ERGQPGGASDGIFFMRVMAEGLVGGEIESFAGEERREWKYAPAEALAQDEHVRDNAEMLAGEQASGATERDGNLVQNQQRAVFVAGGADAFPVLRRRDEGRAAHRLADHRGHVALLIKDIFDVVGAGETAGLAAAERTMAMVRRRGVFAAGQQRSNPGPEQRFAAHRDGIERRAVERVPEGNKLESPGGDAGELEGQADGRGAAGRKEDAIEVARGEFDQLSGQGNGRFAGIAPCAERKRVELLFDRGDDPRVAKADLVNIVPVKIEVTSAGHILEPRAPAG